MAGSPAHRFGQIVGELLEDILAPRLQRFCAEPGLYLDRKGKRGAAREGRKVTWEDKFGNRHDLDFVIEQGGTPERRGRPLAFIEAAWRRYTKHSRNKAQEIQGAVLPIAEKYAWDNPFLGVVLAGVFTENALAQMRSSGFEVVLFPYENIVAAFAALEINAGFTEDTPDAEFARTVAAIEALNEAQRETLKTALIRDNEARLQHFLDELQAKLDRYVTRIVLTALHGRQAEFDSLAQAVGFVQTYDETAIQAGGFKKYEIGVTYSNGDHVEAAFQDKCKAIAFLTYLAQA